MATFTPTEKKNLTKFLACAVNQEETLSLDGLHGFLFGLAIIPEPIAPSEHLASIFGEEMLLLDDGKEGERLLGKLLAVSNRIGKLNTDGELSFPFGDPIKSKDIPRAQDWTCGLYLAIGLRPEIWGMHYKVTARGDGRDNATMNVSACYSVVMGICTPEKVTRYIQQLAGDNAQVEKQTAEFLARLFALLPKTVAALQKHANDVRDGLKVPDFAREAGPQKTLRVEKVGRNDPCPCGSGNKFKKCCGK